MKFNKYNNPHKRRHIRKHGKEYSEYMYNTLCSTIKNPMSAKENDLILMQAYNITKRSGGN